MIAKIHIEVGEGVDPNPYKKASVYRTVSDKYGEMIPPEYVVVWTTPTDTHCVKLSVITGLEDQCYRFLLGQVAVDLQGRPETSYYLPHSSSSAVRLKTRIYRTNSVNCVRFLFYTQLIKTSLITASMMYKFKEVVHDG